MLTTYAVLIWSALAMLVLSVAAKKPKLIRVPLQTIPKTLHEQEQVNAKPFAVLFSRKKINILLNF